MFFNSIRWSLILALKSDNKFVVFKNSWVCLFQRCDQRNDIANLVTLKTEWSAVSEALARSMKIPKK